MMRILLLTVLLCASVTAVPSIPDTLLIDDWVLCGPFMVGAREFLTGVVDDPLNFRPQVGDSYPSSLVQGGYAVTRVISPDSTGWLETNYPDVLWDSIQTWYGVTGLTGAGFAYAEFELPGPRRALALSPGLGGFVLNGRSYTGDYYASNYYLVPVELDSGTNRVLLRLSGFGDQRFRFALAPAAHAVLSVTADATLPDLTADQALTAWAGIPLLNTTGEQLDAVRLRVRRADELVADTLINGLPAFGAGNIPVQLTLPAVSRDSIDPVLRLVCEVIADGDTAIDTLRVAIRRPDEAHRRTFISSIDGSCQFYGLRYPADYDPDRNYPVILLLHGGAGDAYSWAKFPVQKDWAFVVTPTNRRPYGFNWQDWGRLDCIEVLDTALTRLPIDPDRVLISGGSMGGHGSWHVATSHPDRFAVVAPIASWSTIQLYIPGIFQRSAIFAEPGVLAFREMVLQSDNVPGMLSNLNNLPAFILHGGADGMVPPLMARGLAGWLDELGYEYQYKEVPERGHWWRYEDLDISVVDDPDLLEYIRDRKRVSAPRQVRYRTADLGTSSGAYWVSIERVRTVGRFADIRAEVVGDSIAIETGNISQFRLELNEQLLPSGTADIIIDGQSAGRVSAVTGP